MSEQDWLAERFDEHRDHLGAVAYRMLGSRTDADDALQEAWLRFVRSDSSQVENMGGWLTTIVSRVCLNILKSRTTRNEARMVEYDTDSTGSDPDSGGPEFEAIHADSVGVAMLVVLETLTPAERLAFVLHDIFAMPFDDIAPIVERTPVATRQLASRARRRVQNGGLGDGVDRTRHQEVVGAFLAASRGGDFGALLELLDPDVVLRADAASVRTGAEPEVAGAHQVARVFSGRARAAQAAMIDGAPGLVWLQRGDPRVVFCFTISGNRIVGIELLAEPSRLETLDIALA